MIGTSRSTSKRYIIAFNTCRNRLMTMVASKTEATSSSQN